MEVSFPIITLVVVHKKVRGCYPNMALQNRNNKLNYKFGKESKFIKSNPCESSKGMVNILDTELAYMFGCNVQVGLHTGNFVSSFKVNMEVIWKSPFLLLPL